MIKWASITLLFISFLAFRGLAQNSILQPIDVTNVAQLQSIAICDTGGEQGMVAFVSGSTVVYVRDNHIYTRDCLSEDEPIMFADIPDIATSMQVVGDDFRLLVVSYDNKVAFWDVENRQQSHVIETGEPISSVAVSYEDGIVAIGHMHGLITVWNFTTGTQIATLDTDAGWPIANITFETTVDILITANYLGLLSWDIESGTSENLFPYPTNIAIYHHPTGQLAYKTDEGSVYLAQWPIVLWDDIALDQTYRNAIVFNPTGSLLVWADNDDHIAFFDTENSILIARLEIETNLDTRQVWTVNFNPEGTLLAVTYSDGTIQLWGVLIPQP